MRNIVLLLLQHLHSLNSAQCPTPSTELVVAKKGVYCSASSSFHTMPCQFAWDGDPNTVWHPTGSGEGAYTTLHLNEAILVTGVVVDQYSWSSGFAANLGLMFNSSEWIELRVKIFSGCGINITFRFATTLFKSQAVEAAPGRGTNKRSNPTKDLPPPSNEMGIPTNMFGFTSDQEDVKQLPGLGVLPGLVVGAAILLGLFCISALVYGFHARRRHRWHISEEERVSFSPSRQGDSEEEVYDRVTTEEQ